MKKAATIFLLTALILPVVLLMWPFAEWNDLMSLILRVIPSAAGQMLLCRFSESTIVELFPSMLTGAFAAWGTYLFLISPHWSNASVGDLIPDYISPFFSCIVVLILFRSIKNDGKAC